MRKVFLQTLISLDGYMAGLAGELDWFVLGPNFFGYVSEMLASIDGVLLGRVTYQHFASYWPTATNPGAGRMNEVEKIVFSRTLTELTWQNSRLAKGSTSQEIARLKARPGKDIAIFGSAGLAASLAEEGLIDEFRIFVNPVVLGAGRPMLPHLTHRMPLTLTATRRLESGTVLLTYRPQTMAKRPCRAVPPS